MPIDQRAVMNSNDPSQQSSGAAALIEPVTGLWPAGWEESIKRRIVERTGGRIQSLRVEITGSRVVIHGSAPSYYLTQLALRGVRDVLGSAANRIELNVEVSGNP